MLKISAGVISGTILASCAPAAAPTAAPDATKAPEATAVPATKKVEGKVGVMHFAGEFKKEIIEQIQKDHPGITIEFTEAGADMTKFYAMTAAGTPPDLMRIQAPSIPPFLARKLLFDLTPYFQTSKLIKVDDLMPANNFYMAESPLAVGKGKIYGMVKDFSPDLTVFANKDLFSAAGVTLDDTKSYSFVEIADMAKKVVKQEGDRMLTFGYGYEGAWIDRFWMVALAETGAKLYSDAFDKINLTANDEAKKIAQFYFDLQKDKLTYSAINPSPNGWPGTDFSAGVLGFEQYGYWYNPMAEGDKTKGKLMLLPAPNWAGKRSDPTITATGMIMSKATQNPDAAWTVFEDYNGGPDAHARAKSGWGVPGLKSLLPEMPQNTDFQKQCYKVLQGELALNDKSFQFNPFLGEAGASAAINKYMELAVKGQIKVEEMLKNVEDEVNATIKDGIGAIMG